jgi:hypothetical protein
MKSRSFASHFILLPGGEIGKWPVVTVSPSGVIESVEVHPEGFKERPGLEFHPGVLAPAFVDVCKCNVNSEFDNRLLNRHFAAGSILLGHSNFDPQRIHPPFFADNSFADSSIHETLGRDNERFKTPIFERLKLNNEDHIGFLLYIASEWGAKQTIYKDKLGQLKTGYMPGLLIVKSLNLSELKITASSYIKWLIVPNLNI